MCKKKYNNISLKNNNKYVWLTTCNKCVRRSITIYGWLITYDNCVRGSITIYV